ncbi:MAG: hypothetical protein N3E36_04310 [Sulfolobales archaeon]|nr:hypothetical protein [Sulfolobales archaeon]MCX8199237.1 hypothetical protein [Sulfolobales archaeon]MDW8170449.1 hypothetical protein [Desulfurococcaceae archaeon]
MGLFKWLINGLKHVPLLIGLLVFYSYGFLWTIKPRRVKDMNDVLKLFYYDFLKLEKEYVEVVKLLDKELVTISRNPCPILKLTLMLGLDTRYTCKLISERVCRFVLKRMDPRLVFERNYEYIRPYKDGCLERIQLRNN